MSGKRYVRGDRGLLPVNDCGFTINEIKRWRNAEYDAGRPSSLNDFYAVHHICPMCSGEGVCMVGWSKPVKGDEAKAAAELDLEELPVYTTCTACDGTGRPLDK